MKKLLLTLVTSSLCLGLVSCSSDETTEVSVTSTIPQTNSATASTPTTEGTTPLPAEGQGIPDGQGGQGNQGGQGMMLPEGTTLPDGFETMTPEEQGDALSELGLELPMGTTMGEMGGQMGQQGGQMGEMDGQTGQQGGQMGQMGQMGLPMLPEGIELPEDFETMTPEEQMAVLESLGLDLPEMMSGMEPMMNERGEDMAQQGVIPQQAP